MSAHVCKYFQIRSTLFLSYLHEISASDDAIVWNETFMSSNTWSFITLLNKNKHYQTYKKYARACAKDGYFVNGSPN